MSSRYKFSEEEIAAIEEARKVNKDKRAEARLKALELRAKGSKLKEVAEKTGFHEVYITALVAKYRNKGLEWIAGSNYGGNRRNMSVEEEAEILAPFRTRAEKGEIEEAYQAKVDHQIGNSQIYFVLHRQGWRKVMPRSRHPKKASEEVIETSKKLTIVSET